MSVLLVVCLGLVLGLAACGSADNAASGSEGSTPAETEGEAEAGSEEVPNPVVDYPTLADANAAAGFEMSAPDQLLGLSVRAYDVIDGSLIQVVYGEDGQLTVRKGADESDVSGVYETFASKDSMYVGDVTVTCQGTGGTISLVTWVADGHFFSAYSTDGLTGEQAFEIASSVG